MADMRHGRFIWPNLVSPVGASYTNSHGITPGIADIGFLPQLKLPDGFGDLKITDGVGQFVVPGCKVDSVRRTTDGNGTVDTLMIADRRWRWRDSGKISGEYNQLDPHGKLIPWTIRSPKELAELCFEALGEKRFEIDLPPGLTKADGANLNAFVGVGVNFPPSGTNPPINWVAQPPAAALQSLLDMFGRRLVYDVLEDTFRVVVLGIGPDLPSGSISSTSPSLSLPDFPEFVETIGDPTRFQGRWAVEPVGEEWHGGLVPINALSYAPQSQPKEMTWKVVFEVGDATPVPASVVYVKVYQLKADGTEGATGSDQYTIISTETDNSAATAVKNRLTAQSQLTRLFDITTDANAILITGKKGTGEFVCEARFLSGVDPNPDAYVRCQIVTPYTPSGADWGHSPPPLFPGVRATDRLTRIQAQELARKHVWKTYRLTGVDVSGSGKPFVPGYGTIEKVWQLYLLDSRVQQIVPQAADETFIGKDGQPLIVYYYNGYSKDQPPAAYGSVSIFELNAAIKPGKAINGNTPANSQIMLGMSVDPIYQTVTFDGYAYKLGDGGRLTDPKIVIETAVYVRDPETNAFERYTDRLDIRGGTAPGRVAVHSDVQLNVVGYYTADHKFERSENLEEDAVLRAKYYTDGLSKQFRIGTAKTNVYNGIVPIPCSGTVQQVTWSVGGSGARTQASTNTEHHPYIAPYPARRRAENLSPAQQERQTDGTNRDPRIRPGG